MRGLVVGLALVSASAEFPTPLVETAVQKAVMTVQAAKAKLASEAATAQVTALFDAASFRQGLKKCCPTVASLSSEELLTRFRSEVRTAELAHTFPSGYSKAHFQDITIPVATQHDWFLNEWQAPMLNNRTGSSLSNIAEEGIFGCQRFQNESQPTWDEAADRLIYVAHNMRQLDTGSLPFYGDVTAVFRKSYVYDQVLIAAIDSGMYEMSCNKSAYPNASHGMKNLNCDAMEFQVGTLEHLDHIIISNLAVWSSAFNRTVEEQAVDLFSRSAFAGDYLSLGSTDMHSGLTYYEANILSNPRLPDGVSFLIGNVVTLFGTDAGRELQLLADHYSWPLVWALGSPTTGPPMPGSPPYAGNQRILDAEVLSTQSLNATASSGARDAFVQVWIAIADRRKNSPLITEEEWSRYWSNLTVSQPRLAPLTARAGCVEDSCIGTMAVTGRCVCKQPSDIVAAEVVLV